ncbi:hypothetical protein CPB83DRAFT_891489 [Crepidotus variabilis]|uniref:Uncharacterized protein n=1 Tax=Crepidotus variabilis TaxID=179855 RepID=A0A9P6EM51_9AGAR|nr:hypothetical protein CPB83DRAFT_891489 [Crepidotus variabilis]
MTDQEEDIAKISNLDKGKSKQRPDHDLASTPDSSSERLDDVVYPPVSDDAEESRRVEENLRRWEVAERQRRKSARESQTNPGGGASLVSDVSRRASLLFSGRKSKQHSISSLGNHRALRSRDSIDVLPLNEAKGFPLSSPTPSEPDADPFVNPQDIPLSPFDDAHAANQSASQSSRPLLRERSSASSLNEDTTHTEQHLQRPPPVKPIDLPLPRSPPPINTPPPPISPLDPTSPSGSAQKEEHIRWWHDWLCGCTEGPDRGGEFQAGRTNPNE